MYNGSVMPAGPSRRSEGVYITALFAFFNRVADAFGLEDPGYALVPPTSVMPK